MSPGRALNMLIDSVIRKLGQNPSLIESLLWTEEMNIFIHSDSKVQCSMSSNFELGTACMWSRFITHCTSCPTGNTGVRSRIND